MAEDSWWSELYTLTCVYIGETVKFNANIMGENQYLARNNSLSTRPNITTIDNRWEAWCHWTENFWVGLTSISLNHENCFHNRFLRACVDKKQKYVNMWFIAWFLPFMSKYPSELSFSLKQRLSQSCQIFTFELVECTGWVYTIYN